MNAVAGTPASAGRVVRAMLVMVCALGLLAAASGSALAKTKAKAPTINPKTPITSGSTYLALGDSVPFGFQEAQVVPAPDYSNAANFVGYPELVGSALHVKVVNAACPGETSSSFINAAAQSNGCENTPGGAGVAYRTHFPLHVHYTGSQLGFAVAYLKKHSNVRLVSLMIGANDNFLCQETTADHCASLTEQTAVLATVTKNVKTILSTIRNKAHYRGQLAIVNYYSLDYANSTLNAQSAVGNQAIDNAARPFHVVVADEFAEFQVAALHSAGSPCAAGLLTQLHGASTPCGVHPSLAGQSVLAHGLEKAIRLG